MVPAPASPAVNVSAELEPKKLPTKPAPSVNVTFTPAELPWALTFRLWVSAAEFSSVKAPLPPTFS